MLEFQKLYQNIYKALESIRQADQAEKVTIRNNALEKKQQISKEAQRLEQIINDILPFQKSAEAYVSSTLTYKKHAPIKTDISTLQRLYYHATTTTTSTNLCWEKLYETAAGGVAYYTKLKNDLWTQEKPTISFHSSHKCDEDCKKVLLSDETKKLIQALRSIDIDFTPRTLVTKQFIAPQKDTSALFGKLTKPFPVTDGCVSLTKQLFGGYYLENDQALLLPCSLPSVTFFQISSSTAEQIMSAIRAYIIAFLCHTKPIQQKIYYIDTCTMDPSCLGILHPLLDHNSEIVMPIPTNQEESRRLLALLRQSVFSCNSHGRRLIVYRFRQSSYDSQCNSQMQWICANAATYNMQVIIVQETARDKQNLEHQVPDWIPSNSLIIRFGTHKCLESVRSHSKIATYPEPSSIPPLFFQDVNAAYAPAPLETQYFKVQPLSSTLSCQRDRKKAVSLLYGVGENGEKYYLDLTGSDFSAYILGAARSGKSNLLHVLITSAIVNYHPDDLELWLIDFGRTEFIRYVDHTPPHVRYVIVDKTTELVSGLVVKLIAEMDRRGDILSRYNALKIQDLPESVHLPTLLVIIDEFGVFKEILSSDDFDEKKKYKAYMERLLKQGAKHGMCFVFSNQSFTDVYSALPEEGSDQIGLRLAMYANNKNEMRAVLETKNSHLSDEEEMRINKLPLYQVLQRSSIRGGLSRSIHVLNMTRDEDKTLQEQLIDKLNNTYKPTSNNGADKPETYHAHLRLCLKYDAIPTFQERFDEIKKDYGEWTRNVAFQDTDLLLYLGEPRNMDSVHHEMLRNGYKENLILYGDYARSLEKIAQVIAGAVNSAYFQKWPVEFWCDEKDLLAKAYFNKWKTGLQINNRKKLVSRIKELNMQVKNKTLTKRLIIVSGLSLIIHGIIDEMEEASMFGNEKTIDEKGLQKIRELMANGGVTEPHDDEGGEELEDIAPHMSSLFKVAPHYDTHFILVVQKEEELVESYLTTDHFTHYAAFSNGLSDTNYYSFKRRVDRISTGNMFGCMTGNSEFTVYAPFSI